MDQIDRLLSEQLQDPAFGNLSQVTVPPEGARLSNVFIIGEAPGAQEELRRRPFVGPAGIIMRDLMELAGLFTADKYPASANCWLTNVVKFRPPGNRKPTDDEIRAARPYLRREWVLCGCPTVIVPTGGVALQTITGRKTSILRAAGKLHQARSKDGKLLAVWPMVHPAFGLRNEAVRPHMERDWERLGEWLATYQR